MKRMKGLAGIFKYYDVNSKNLLKIKAEGNKSIFISIPQSNFSILNGEVLGEDRKLAFKLSHI